MHHNLAMQLNGNLKNNLMPNITFSTLIMNLNQVI